RRDPRRQGGALRAAGALHPARRRDAGAAETGVRMGADPMAQACCEAPLVASGSGRIEEMRMREIANSDLELADIPPASANWDEMGAFALTYNAYKVLGPFEACAEIANAQRHGSLAELRTCLFFEQRRWQHFGGEPDSEAMAYVRGIVEQIRKHVAA